MVKEIFYTKTIPFTTAAFINEIIELSSIQTSVALISTTTSVLHIETSGIFPNVIPFNAKDPGTTFIKNLRMIPSDIIFVSSTGYTGTSLSIQPQTILQSAGSNTEYSLIAFGLSFVSASGGSVAKSTNVYIGGAPLGSAVTKYAFEVASGISYFGGTIILTSLSGGAGGSNTQLQFNNNGSFAGSSNLTWTTSSNTLTISGIVNANTGLFNALQATSYISSSLYSVTANLNNVFVNAINAGYFEAISLNAQNTSFNNSGISVISSSNLINVTSLTVNGPASFNNITSTFYNGNQLLTNWLTVTGPTSLLGPSFFTSISEPILSATSLSVSGQSIFIGPTTITSLLSGNLSSTSLIVSGPSSLTGLITATSISTGNLSTTSLTVNGPSSFNGLINFTSVSIGQLSVTTLNVLGPSIFISPTSATYILTSRLSTTTLNILGSSFLIGFMTVNNNVFADGISTQTLPVSGPSNFVGLMTTTDIISGQISVTTLTVLEPISLSDLVAASILTGNLSTTSLTVSGPSSLTGLVTATSISTNQLSVTSLTIEAFSPINFNVQTLNAMQISTTSLTVSDTSTLNDISATSISSIGINSTGFTLSKNSWKTSVLCSSNTNQVISTLQTGSIIDTVTLTQGSRILLPRQTDSSQNGLYSIFTGTAPSRTYDAQTGFPAQGSAIYVEQGLMYANTIWFCNDLANYGSSISFKFTGVHIDDLDHAVELNYNGELRGSEELFWYTQGTLRILNTLVVGTSTNIGRIDSTTLYITAPENIIIGSQSSDTILQGSYISIGTEATNVVIGNQSSHVTIFNDLYIRGSLDAQEIIANFDIGSGNALGIQFTEFIDTVSLKKYKTDIQDPDENDFLNILDLQPKYFTWTDTGKRDLGLVVEDTNKYQYLIEENDVSINYNDRALITSLIQGAKNHEKRIQEMFLKV